MRYVSEMSVCALLRLSLRQAPSGALGPGVVLMGAWTLGEMAVELASSAGTKKEPPPEAPASSKKEA